MKSALFKFFQFGHLLEASHLKVVLLLTVGFGAASLLGYLAWRVKLSPILGYLVAGYLIGPFSPGFVADLQISEQLAEIGVILMLFGVGLDFKIEELLKVKNIAIPGAIGQTVVAAVCSTLIVYFMGWSMSSGLIIGMAVGVASTVVLVRMLADSHLLKTREGHIAVGWLIVEDIITVIILILIPNLATLFSGEGFSVSDFAISLAVIVFKFAFLTVILLLWGHKFVSFILSKVERTHSHELFTLALLAATFLLAVGSTLLFGISIALGAFIAGLVIGQTALREKAFIHSRPMKDAFIAIFFLSVGMLFNPDVIVKHFPIFISILAVIIFLKPITAFLIAVGLKHPLKTATVIAVSLAQIGEFSFILSEEAMKYGLLSDDGYDLIVACALVSIAINPIIFKILHRGQEV